MGLILETRPPLVNFVKSSSYPFKHKAKKYFLICTHLTGGIEHQSWKFSPRLAWQHHKKEASQGKRHWQYEKNLLAFQALLEAACFDDPAQLEEDLSQMLQNVEHLERELME